jgi:hypothetical protein
MNPKFNIDRPKVSDEEIKKHQNFNDLVEQFKKQSLKKARGDESWWKNKKITYSTVIAGITVVCTITYFSIVNQQTKQNIKNETLITQKKSSRSLGTGTEKKAFVSEPSSKLKIPYSTYKVDSKKGGNIAHSSSSKIKIPQNSFVDKHGKEIVGEVTIHYKEFHDLGDVVVSGIPMAYDSAGTKYNLESAGMFDIRGYQNGEPVFIKKDKNIEVQLASQNADDRFNQYYLDTVNRNWQYLKRDNIPSVSSKTIASHVEHANALGGQPSNTPKLNTLKQQIETIIPKKIDSVQKVYTAQIEKLPVPKEPVKPVKQTQGRPTFKLEGSYNDFPELSAFDNVIFEVGSENKNYSKELHDITWSDVKVTQGPVKGKNYVLNLSYRNRNEKLVVYPVLSVEEFSKAEKQFEKRFETYQGLVEKREAKEKQLLEEMTAKQAAYLKEQKRKQQEYENELAKLKGQYDVIAQNELSSNFNTMSNQVKTNRIFAVSSFGIYNSDCPHPLPEAKSVAPVFITEKATPVYPDQIYLVDHSIKSVFGLSRDNGFKFNYKEGSVYSICIFSQNKLFICTKNQFKESLEHSSNKFTVSQIEDETSNIADLKKVLEI